MSQHNIIGSEAFETSPFIVIRSVRTGGLRRKRARVAVAFAAGAAVALALGVGAVLVAFGPTLIV